MRSVLTYVGLALAVALFGGCGGGGDGDSALPAGGGSSPALSKITEVVVRYDHDGDGNPDVLTLDASVDPFEIVEALEGTDAGDAVDATEVLKGRAIDPAISTALANHRAESFEIDVEIDLEVQVDGVPVTVTVIE